MSYQKNRAVNFTSAFTGLVGTMGYRLYNADGSPNGARITAGTNEIPAGSGIYQALITFPTGFQGLLIWDDGGSPAQYAPIEINPSLADLSGGTAQAGAAATITLASTAIANDSHYNGQLLVLVGGTGVGQSRTIKSYVGASKVATVDRAWVTNPDATSVYMILPYSLAALDTTLSVQNTIGFKKNGAYNNFVFQMVDVVDHVTPKTGLMVGGQVSKDGAAFVALDNSGAITEIGNGYYKVNLTANDLNASNASLHFTATGTDATDITLLLQ